MANNRGGFNLPIDEEIEDEFERSTSPGIKEESLAQSFLSGSGTKK